MKSTEFLFLYYLNAEDIELFSDDLWADCWIFELALTKDPVLKHKTPVMQNDAEKQNNYNKKLYISLPLPHGQQHCDNDGEQEWCSGDCACPLPSIMWPDLARPGSIPRSRTICGLCLLFDSRHCSEGLTVGTPVKPSPQKAGVCGRAVNTTNSGGPGLKPRSSRCIFRQLILLHFVSLHPGV